jgi:hypothetical protein
MIDTLKYSIKYDGPEKDDPEVGEDDDGGKTDT